MMMRFIFVLFLFFSVQILGQEDARKKILASREKRRKQLENVLSHQRKRLNDHYSGKNWLKADQVKHHEHKVRAYEHQLEQLSRELDEAEITKRIENYEKLKASRGHDEL